MHVLAASGNSPGYTLTLSLEDHTKLAASDYAVNFTSATGGSMTRRSDNTQIGFTYTAATGKFLFQTAAGPVTGTTFDGLSFATAAGTTVAGGHSFLLKPFSAAASNVSAEFSTPRSLAVASPVAGKMGATNTGSLQVSALVARDNPLASVPVVITFTGANTYTRSDDAVNTYAYVSGTAIEANLPSNYPTTPYTYAALDNWSLTLQGIPKIGDTFTVEAQPAAFRNLNSGNAGAMMALRDVATFDGASLTDGYAGLIAQIGIRSQSASYTAGVSSAIASSLEKDRTAVSGVNLDEEAAKLLQYQQAYQASAKVIQIAQGIFDTLIQTISR
jgi:flagellar hook-associated protein 1 FlgK